MVRRSAGMDFVGYKQVGVRLPQCNAVEEGRSFDFRLRRWISALTSVVGGRDDNTVSTNGMDPSSDCPHRTETDTIKHTYMTDLATAELCDTNAALVGSGELRVLQPIFKAYGRCRAFCGPLVTLKVFEDNVLVREVLESKGGGRVLVIDGGGSLRCALVGGNLVQLAQNMGWAGILVNGCVRDVDEIDGCDIGVRALSSNPFKSNKKGDGEKHVSVHIAGTLIHDGEWLYADSDGILISKIQLSI